VSETRDERLEKLLKTVLDHFDNEDTAVRERQIIQWKKLKYYWAGFQRIWWSTVAHDWRVFDEQTEVGDSDGAYYDKPINVFRAYLESIIAALSITIPAVKCYPDDAENPLDLETAKAGDKIADLIGKHNEVSLLWLHALFIYCTEGMVACYNYDKEDYKFGEYSVPKKQKSEETVDEHVCPNCGTVIPQDLANRLTDEFDPDEDDVQIQDLLKSNKFCPQCEQEVEATVQQKKIIVERVVGSKTKPKSRQCLECYGGLFVKVPNYARKQEDCPYLIFSYETHFSNALDRYDELRDRTTKDPKIGSGDQGGSGNDLYARWGRLSTQYYNEQPNNTVTIRNAWLRPSSFNVLADKEDVKYLKQKFPDGARCVFVNDIYCESENECLDDSWTITHNPLSDYIHFDPLGLLLTSVQEITNDLTSLILQTIEHGIPQTFASPDILNFDQYRQMEVSPGAIIPTKTGGGKQIGEAFFTVKTAALSAEVLPFTQQVQEAGQLVSGALPSLFGGAQSGGSKTAAQYSMSRAQAQQRLGTTWKMFNVWWKDIFGKVIPRYIKNLHDDERYVEKDAMGGFINVFIHKAELEGKIGSIELDSSEELPSTWAQKKDVVMQLLQSGNQEVMAAISSPENIPLLAQAIGLEDFYTPGADDREKQYEEIKLLLQSEPIPGSVGPDGQPIEEPSVPIEPDVDNDAIQLEICKSWAVGPQGRDAKINNPKGYKNVLLHAKMHADNMKQQMAPPPSSQPQNPAASKAPMGAGNAPQ
jgi:hypothetical protein